MERLCLRYIRYTRYIGYIRYIRHIMYIRYIRYIMYIRYIRHIRWLGSSALGRCDNRLPLEVSASCTCALGLVMYPCRLQVSVGSRRLPALAAGLPCSPAASGPHNVGCGGAGRAGQRRWPDPVLQRRWPDPVLRGSPGPALRPAAGGLVETPGHAGLGERAQNLPSRQRRPGRAGLRASRLRAAGPEPPRGLSLRAWCGLVLFVQVLPFPQVPDVPRRQRPKG